MRRQLIIISMLMCAAVALKGVKWTVFPYATGYAAYGFNSLILILIFIAIVLALDLFYLRHSKPSRPSKAGIDATPANRRQSYRITYPSQYRPRLVIENTGETRRRDLEFAIIDLSQEGVCFSDDGSLGPTTRVSGYIKLNNERSLCISGRIVRSHGNQVCIQFFHPIAWVTLLEEQRRLIHIQPGEKR